MKTFFFILFIFICTLSIQAQPTTSTLASELSISSKIIIDSLSIYWAEDDGTVPYYDDATTGMIRKVSKNGGPVIALASGLNHPIAVLLDSSNVYFIERGSWPNSNGALKKISKNGGSTTILASGLNYPQGPAAMNSTHIYWQEPTSIIKKISIDGGTVTTFYNGTPIWSLGYISLDATEIFWSEPNTDATTHDLKKMSLEGSNVTTLATQLSASGANIVLDTNNVYWSDQGVPPYGQPIAGGGVVKKISKNGGSATTLASGLNAPSGIALDSYNGYLYWSDGGTWTSDVYDTNTGSIKKISIGGGTITTLASGLNAPGTIQLDNMNIYWAETPGSGEGSIKKMSREGGEQSTTPRIAFASNRDGNYEIYLMNPEGTGLQRLTYNDSADASPSWSPNGNKILFESNRDGNSEIYVMNSDGTNQTRLTDNAVVDGAPSWSPDGSKIVFGSNRDGQFEIYVMDIDGTNPVNITNNPDNYDSGPKWSPDGTKIVFSSWRSGTADIWVMNNDGSNTVQLTSGEWAGSPCWSPDGNKIAYAATGAIRLMNADGTNKTILLNVGCCVSPNPGSWSPDGTKIVLSTDRFDGNYEIYVMNSDGTNLIRITDNVADDQSPSWSPFVTPQPATESPRIISVKDVANDQGGKVSLNWELSSLDTNIAMLTHYSIWRAVPQGSVQKSGIVPMTAISGDFKGTAYRVTSTNGATYFWEWIANQPAHRFTEYSYTAATLYDSMSTTNGKHYFLVSAHTNDPNVFYDSNVDSGYSVDNLAPLAPEGFAALFASGQVTMHWKANVENDLHSYVLFRGSSSVNFVEFGTTSDTQYVDQSPISGNSYYAVRAMDIHENLSPISNTIVTGVAEEDQQFPKEYALNQNYPNPFNPFTTIKYALPQASQVNLSVFNTLGQRVALLVDEKQEPGYHEVNFNAAGLTSGVYFYKIQAGEYTETKKLILVK